MCVVMKIDFSASATAEIDAFCYEVPNMVYFPIDLEIEKPW